MGRNILIYDIECATNGVSVKDIHLHKFKYAGAYSYKDNKYYFIRNLEDLQKLFDSHKILVGFNNYRYDNPILERYKIDFKYKIIIDLYKVIKTRAGLIKFKNTFLSYHLKNYSLDTITKTLGLVKENGKKDIDYKIFDIENPTEEQLKEIEEYTLRDIEITEKLFNYVEEEFEGWKAHLSLSDVKKLKHISTAPSVYAYKVLAERCGFKEEYKDVKEKISQGIGGYVSYPAAEKVEGNIYCLDFSSLYPHIMIQCNLYERNKNGEKGWNGNGIFKTKGTYGNNWHIVSKVLVNIYNERKELKKKNDPKEYGLKIVLNTIYGLLRNPKFVNVYDNIAGEDCCIIGQQWIKLARQYFKDAGYFVIYTDTDSVYIKDVFNDKQKIIDIKNKIISFIKQNVPFPVNSFDMGIDYEIDMIHFFKGGNKKRESELDDDDIENQRLGLMKKNYLFIYRDNNNQRKVFIKNLGIVKRTCSQLSKKIFWDKIVPEILKTNDCKFYQNQIIEWINDLINEDVSLISKRMAIQEKKYYKNDTCIQMQAYNYIPSNSKEYLGAGIHYFIPNKRYGFGKGSVKYCLIEEYKKYLTVNDLFIHGIIRELKYFNYNFKDKIEKEKSLDEMTIQPELW
jgi:DNA polymerase elongation subunit (family B)